MADTVVGYGMYVDLIRDRIAGKTIISTGMTREVQRVEAAIETALKGDRVALVSSGDPGIYAMAGLVFEMLAARGIEAISALKAAEAPVKQAFTIEIIPGIPALCAGAALLGAPLTHDFAVISLSDLLTPWDVIEKRITAAAKADFVIVIYNPKSKKRHWQLDKAQQLILQHRSGRTPVGVTTKAMRPQEEVTVTTLGALHRAEVNMQSTVFIGNGTTTRWKEFIYTPRGYGKKYVISS